METGGSCSQLHRGSCVYWTPGESHLGLVLPVSLGDKFPFLVLLLVCSQNGNDLYLSLNCWEQVSILPGSFYFYFSLQGDWEI